MRDPIFLVDRMRIDRRRAESWWRSYTDRHRSLLENRPFFDRKTKDGPCSRSGAGRLLEMPQRCVQTLYLMSLLRNSSSARFFCRRGVVVAAGQAGAVDELEHDGERASFRRRHVHPATIYRYQQPYPRLQAVLRAELDGGACGRCTNCRRSPSPCGWCCF